MAPTKTELIDLFWRGVWTFLQGASAILIGLPVVMSTDTVGFGTLDINALELLLVSAIFGGLTGVLSVVKTFSSNKLGTGTATSRTSASVGLNPVAGDSAQPAGSFRPPSV